MANIRKNILFLITGTALIVGLSLGHLFWRSVDIKGQKFVAELPLTSQSYEKGLGGREHLCSNCAMLFNFSHKGQYAFWMKDMKFGLDILWIEDGRIVYIKKNISADSAEIFRPDATADGVLEINAGLSDKYNFQVGGRVKIY